MANVLKKWVESDKRELKRLGKIADQVEAYANDMEALSDEELKQRPLNLNNAIKMVKL